MTAPPPSLSIDDSLTATSSFAPAYLIHHCTLPLEEPVCHDLVLFREEGGKEEENPNGVGWEPHYPGSVNNSQKTSDCRMWLELVFASIGLDRDSSSDWNLKPTSGHWRQHIGGAAQRSEREEKCCRLPGDQQG